MRPSSYRKLVRLNREGAIFTGAAIIAIAAAVIAPTLQRSDQAPYLTVPNDQGFYACSVFDAQWGPGRLDLDIHTGCAEYAPNLAVWCFTGDGRWTQETVSDVVYIDNAAYPQAPTISYTVQQDGTCGLFPTTGVVAPTY
jgi:hypothetical protein